MDGYEFVGLNSALPSAVKQPLGEAEKRCTLTQDCY